MYRSKPTSLAGFTLLAVFLLALSIGGCGPKAVAPAPAAPPPAPEPVDLTVYTQPAGGTVTVEETGDAAPDGGVIKLLPGFYTLTAAITGYRRGHQSVTIAEGQPRTVQVPLGKGFAAVEIITEPPGATVRIDAKEEGVTPLTVDLDEGPHQVALSLAGHFDSAESVAVQPAVPLKIVKVLAPVPTAGQVIIKTEPPGGAIIWKNRTVGEGSANLGALPFNRYTVSGVKPVDAVSRLTGSTDFKVETADGLTVLLPLKRRERLFEGQWLPAAEALKQESRRYKAQRVGNPIEITAVVKEGVLAEVINKDGLAQGLHSLLRVGDRIRFSRGNREWLVWKRNATVEEEFTMAVEAIQQGAALTLPWEKDPAAALRIEVKKDPVAAIALALHRKRADLPILYLSQNQLASSGETFPRSKADGELTLIAKGGQKNSAAGIEIHAWAGVTIGRISAGDGVISVQWQKPPEKILVVSDTPAKLAVPTAADVLQIREKKIMTLATGYDVYELTRLSSGPDFPEGWSRKLFQPTGPLAAQMDLSQDEIGPHDREGTYRRAWLVRYRTADGGAHQRQLDCRYEVSGNPKDFSSDRFLRRDSLSQPEPPKKSN